MKRSILRFDDEAACLKHVQKAFGRKYDVRAGMSHLEARRMLSECRADVIIRVPNLPEIRGTDFLREAAGRCPRSCRILSADDKLLVEATGEVSSGLIQTVIPRRWSVRKMRRALELAEVTAFEDGSRG